MNLHIGHGLVGVLLLARLNSVLADDWPQWRGPQRNGVSQETGLLQEWPREGPALVWSVSDAGSGYATPSVVRDHLYMLSNTGLENESVSALSVKDGHRVWSTRLGRVGKPDQKPNFPAARSTPTVNGDLLYALGSDGDLACVETASGRIRWQKNLRTDFNGKPGDWAYSESPLVNGEAVICTPGGSEATLVALNKKTGELIWKSAIPGGDRAAYASVVTVDLDGVKQYVQLLDKGLVGIETKTGKFLWRYEKPISQYGANIPTPLVSDGMIFVGSAGTGAGAVKLNVKDAKVEPEELYFNAKLPTAIGGTVKMGKYLYGATGQALVCVDFGNGQVKWEDRALGAASLCYADGRLYLHGENGEVGLVEATPEGYRQHGRFTPPNPPEKSGQMEKAWAYPVVANGRLYVRDHGSLWCYDIKASR